MSNKSVDNFFRDAADDRKNPGKHIKFPYLEYIFLALLESGAYRIKPDSSNGMSGNDWSLIYYFDDGSGNVTCRSDNDIFLKFGSGALTAVEFFRFKAFKVLEKFGKSTASDKTKQMN